MVDIFYAKNRSDKAVRAHCKKHNIEIDRHATGVELIFIDVEGSDLPELSAVMAKCKEGVTVHLVTLSDLGHGAKAKQIRERIEVTGAVVSVPEKVPQKRGPKPGWLDLTQEQIDAVRPDYDKGVVSQQFICDKILRNTGVEVTRYQLPKIFAQKSE